MKFSASVALSLGSFLSSAYAQQPCSGQNNRFPGPGMGRCLDSWEGTGNGAGTLKIYPTDFYEGEEPILNEVKIYRCESGASAGKRIIISNGIPDHDVKMFRSQAKICEANYAVELPLNPTFLDIEQEVGIRGMIAIAKNGVPAFGPQEVNGFNALNPQPGDQVQDAKYWYGHPSANQAWHVHNPTMGENTISPSDRHVNRDDFLGYAMDGFPIFGSLSDDDVDELDSCNGLQTEDGGYEYHVRTLTQVDDSEGYCNGNSPVNRWNYILGCFSGDLSQTEVNDSTDPGYIDGLDLDACELEHSSGETDSPTVSPPTNAPTDAPTAAPTASPTDAPTAAPTASPTDAPAASPTKEPTAEPDPEPTCQDSTFGGKIGGSYRDCTWIVNNNRCDKVKFWSHCHDSCNKCNRCRDSKLRFVYNSQEIKCTNISQQDCADPDIRQTCPDTCGACW